MTILIGRKQVGVALKYNQGGNASINNQDKTITENGVYTADEGYTGLGTVTVDVEGSSVGGEYEIEAINNTGKTIDAGDKVWVNRNGDDYELVNYLKNIVFGSYTVTGNPSINQFTGIANKFSTSNYIETIKFQPETKNFDIHLKIRTANNVSSFQLFLGNGGYYDRCFAGIDNAHFVWKLNNSDAYETNIGNIIGAHNVLPNTNYYIHLYFNGTQYILEYSFDGINYVIDGSISSSTNISDVEYPLTLGANHYMHDVNYPFFGNIDLTQCSIDIDGKRYWYGAIAELNINEDSRTGIAQSQSQPNELTQVMLGSIANQDITITENGVYTADEGYTGLGSVTVDVPRSSQTANYTFTDTTDLVEFPTETIETTDPRFVASYNDFADKVDEEVYVCGEYSGNTLFDKDTTTGSNGYAIFKFPNKAVCNKVRIKVDASFPWSIYATDNLTSAQQFANSATIDTDNGVLLYEDLSSYSALTEIEFENSNEYTYYCYRVDGSYSKTYELSIFYYTGVMNMTLKSSNMTPSIKCFPKDYMQFITQPYHNGSTIIGSQTLSLKPFRDGGDLINYDDNGSEINLKMFLLIPSEEGAEVDFVQPILSANGTMGGDSFAVAMDSEIDASRPAWKAFDGDTVLNDAHSEQAHTSSGQPHWLKFYNPSPIKVSSITIFNGAENVLPMVWEFQYSDTNNDEDWTTLCSGKNEMLEANGEWSFEVPTDEGHQYYRFYVTEGYGADSSYFGITEMQIHGTVYGVQPYRYILSPDSEFHVEGYESMIQVADMLIPPHIYYNGAEWLMGETNGNEYEEDLPIYIPIKPAVQPGIDLNPDD